jgi:hypothetical protein
MDTKKLAAGEASLFFRYSASSSKIHKSPEAKSPTGLTAGL